MKIKNLRKTAAYMGYGPNGFTLQPGGVSPDQPIAMLANPYLQADVRAGNVAVLLDGVEKNHAGALGIVIPAKDANAPEPAVVTRASQARPKETIDAMKAELNNQVAGFVSNGEKIKFLEGLLEKSSPAAKSLAAELLAKLKEAIRPEPKAAPAPETPATPAATPQGEKPTANIAVSDVDKGKSEPMINIGTPAALKPEAPKAEEPAKPETKKKKSPNNMSNLELLQHAVILGCKDATPLTKRKDLLEMVKKAEQPA